MAAEQITERVSLFRSLLRNRRFDVETLLVLESVLGSRDVKSSLEIRSVIKHLLRSEALSVLRGNAEKSLHQKLCLVEFFVNAFALIGDVESCLALKYEALIMRDHRCMNDHWLQVSHEEWLSFAKDSFDNGFYSISSKCCENALLCVQSCNALDVKSGISRAQVEKIKGLRDKARALVASQSVQLQTAGYLKRKFMHENGKHDCHVKDTSYLASSMFRNGIKKRNIQKLHRSLNLPRSGL